MKVPQIFSVSTKNYENVFVINVNFYFQEVGQYKSSPDGGPDIYENPVMIQQGKKINQLIKEKLCLLNFYFSQAPNQYFRWVRFL